MAAVSRGNLEIHYMLPAPESELALDAEHEVPAINRGEVLGRPGANLFRDNPGVRAH